MKMNTVDNTRLATSILARVKGWGFMWVSLLLFTGYQLIGSQVGLELLTKIERQRKWLKPLLFVCSVILIGIWFSLISRPISIRHISIQLLGITAVSSVIVIGYRAVPPIEVQPSWHRVKWWLVLLTLQISASISTSVKYLTQPANRKLALKGLMVLLLFSVVVWHRQAIWQIVQLLQDQDAVMAYLNQFGPLAPVLLSVSLVLQVFIAAIPGHVLMLGGGYLYGFWPIFAISLVTTVGASQLAFLLAKWAGRPFVERLAPPQLLNKCNGAADENGMIFFMFAFMLPVFPADVLNYVAGLSSLSGRRFFVSNLFGRLPGLILLSLLGANGLAVTPQILLTVTAVGVCMFIGWYYLFVHLPHS